MIVFDSMAQLLARLPRDTDAGGWGSATARWPGSIGLRPGFLTRSPLWGAMSPATTYPSGLALPHYATLRLQLKKENWIYKGRDVRGYEAQVIVLKNQLGRAGHHAKIAITFNGVVRGDST
ncbi:MAG: hypothetical protein HS126_37585 [Anaerolineales bacterium]|nr:hypothetical protein [Anaerolineales bacterium]